MPTSAARVRHISDLASKMADFTQLDAAALGQIRKTSEDPPRVSVYDLIRCITGLANPHNAWAALQNNHPEVLHRLENRQFPGSGQRETPVVDARGAVEIIMLLPGRAAAEFRKEAAGVIVRFLGGDLSLVEEVAANHLAQATLPDSHPARLFGQTVESEAAKRLREELVVVELECRLKRARVESAGAAIEAGFGVMRTLGIEPNERDRLMARDVLSTAMFCASDSPPPSDREICIKQVLLEKGLRQPGLDARVGKVAKKLLLDDQPDYEFVKKDIVCNGQVLQANVWKESQRGYVDRALAQLGF